MTDWRDDLRKVRHPDGRVLIGASFRGVAFFVDRATRGGGRRVVLHEFPGRDDPFAEDLGRKSRPFSIEGYVLGDGYKAQKDALLAALEDVEGPGELVHPYEGVKIVVCTGLSVSETKADGGIATFALEFTETPTQAPTPTEIPDAPAQVDASAAAAASASDAELVKNFDANLPNWAFESAEAAITKASDALKAKLAPVVTATQELATLTGQLALLTAEASSLARTPAIVAGKFRAAVQGLKDTAQATPDVIMRGLLDAYDIPLGDPVVAITATGARELANQTALIGALRRVFAVEAARLAPLVTYVTLEDAIAARDRITAQLDEQAGLAGDTAYPALVDLRSQVLQAVPGSAAFARVVTVTRNQAIPSLLLAYQLYGDDDDLEARELDLVARNDISNPAFCVGDLKALSDG